MAGNEDCRKMKEKENEKKNRRPKEDKNHSRVLTVYSVLRSINSVISTIKRTVNNHKIRLSALVWISDRAIFLADGLRAPNCRLLMTACTSVNVTEKLYNRNTFFVY